MTLILCFALCGNGRHNQLKIPFLSLSLSLSHTHTPLSLPPSPLQGFDKPHDLTVDPLNKAVYVTEIGPNRIWKFIPVNRKSIPTEEMFSHIIIIM